MGTAYGLHHYASAGLRTVTLTLTDAAGHAVTQQFSALVGQGEDEPTIGPSAPFASGAFADGGEVIASDGATTSEPDVTPPAVQAVFVSSTAWAPAFLTHLASTGLGSAQYGYAVPAGEHQLKSLPWTNLNQLSIQFTEDVSVDPTGLALYGVNTDTYTPSTFEYHSDTFTATWTLAAPLPADKLLLDLDGNTADAVADLAGNPLDGTWSNADAAESFPSGGGPPGTDFEFRLDVVPGDANQSGATDAGDLVQVRNKGGTSTASPGTAPDHYTPFHDVDGNGAVDAAEVVLVRNRGGTGLPVGTPGVPAAPTGLVATAVGADRIDLS